MDSNTSRVIGSIPIAQQQKRFPAFLFFRFYSAKHMFITTEARYKTRIVLSKTKKNGRETYCSYLGAKIKSSHKPMASFVQTTKSTRPPSNASLVNPSWKVPSYLSSTLYILGRILMPGLKQAPIHIFKYVFIKLT